MENNRIVHYPAVIGSSRVQKKRLTEKVILADTIVVLVSSSVLEICLTVHKEA